MLKIKGLKKKKKGKKGKHKEDDLFDPEELEQYRREHQQKQETGDSSENTGEGPSTGKSEEWKKFQALTAGVDDILKKTQGDLNRIKSSSYYQRKPPGPSAPEPKQETAAKKPGLKGKKWTRFEDGSIVFEEEPEDQPEVSAEQVKVEVEETPLHAEEEEEEEESEQDDDIFDTSYVDVVASGDVKLAYIPDSPTEEDTGPDPFDTSIVDTVIKVDPRKKNLVSLGCAVEVLTGKVEKPVPVPEALPVKRKRPKRRDLLLGSFDELEKSDEPVPVVDTPPSKSILDEEPEFVPDAIDLSINLATTLPQPSPLVDRKNLPTAKEVDQQCSKSIVEEFDIVRHTDPVTSSVVDVDDELDDEFAALAQESILKEPIKGPLDCSGNYDTVCEGTDDGVDPFDTSFASNVLPGKFELKLIEEEVLLKDHDFPTITSITLPKHLENIPSVRLNDAASEHNFLEEEQKPLSLQHRDLLGGSTTDLSKISDCPIEPAAPIESDDISYSDPFDTSVVDVLVAPGKTELKFLEQELLAGVISQIEEDDEFDPRAQAPTTSTKPLVRPDQLSIGEKRLSIPKVVAFNINSVQAETDLLAVDHEENLKVSKPLTPYYANPEELNNRPSCESDTVEDPFDTSFVSHAPGKAELKLLESELVVEFQEDLSDLNFDPRQEVELRQRCITDPSNLSKPPSVLPVKSLVQSPEKLQPDILSGDSDITVKLHTPVVPRKIEDDLETFSYIDPFDTSIVKDILPGKAELKILESELIHSDCGASIKRSYTDPDFNPRDSASEEKTHQEEGVKQEVNSYIDHPEDISIAEKPLTPQSANRKLSFELGEDIDPFDTSCVDGLVPGKTELKLLETELFN